MKPIIKSVKASFPFLLLGLIYFTSSGSIILTNNQLTNFENLQTMTNQSNTIEIKLPAVRLESKVSVEEAMNKRRSHRSFVKSAISLEELGQVLWAAYGISKADNSRPAFRGGLRTAPSAGATYPLEVYAVVGKVKGLEAGVYRYISASHKLIKVIEGDIRTELAKAALNQEMIADAPASLFYSAIFERTEQRYGDRGRERYVAIDLGHSAQNVYLQAEALGMGTCAIGAFNDSKVAQAMQLPTEEEPLYIMPIGRYYRD